MEENEVRRKWYKKKRYIIPLSTFGLVVLVSMFGDADTAPSPQLQSGNQNAEVRTAPDQTIEIPGELNIQQDDPESPPAVANPYETPYNTPYSTPYATPPKKTQSNCDPNYSGCVPIASDVDCASGSGNGPAYVSGPVNVIGYDKYDLDGDGDGVACE